MKRLVPSRLRAPVSMLVGGAVIAAVAVPAHGSHGWKTLLGIGLFTVVSALSWYLAGGRDSDFGALIRDQADERQAYRRLKTQALVGIVMSFATGAVTLAALAASVPIWPFAILVFVPGATFIVGWAIYREPGSRGEDSRHRATGPDVSR
jgi:hypothetical protein